MDEELDEDLKRTLEHNFGVKHAEEPQGYTAEAQLERAAQMLATIRLALKDAGVELHGVKELGPGSIVFQDETGGVYRLRVEYIIGGE